MKSKKRLISISLWIFVLVVIRILYYLFSYSGNMTDSYGFYSLALFNIENGERHLSSGLGFEYLNNLVLVIKVLGDEISNIFTAQLLCEMVGLLLFLFTFMNFFGKKTAFISCTLLAVSPIYIDLLRVVSPEEYFLMYFAFALFMLSLYFKYIQRHILDRSVKNEIIVVFIGFFIGKLIVWNYLGFVPLIIFTIISINSFRLMDDRFSLQLMLDANIEDQDKIMSVSSQLSHLFLGLLIGIFFTLLKFTGYTGYGIVEQFFWWFKQLKVFPKRCMDFNTPAAIWLVCVIIFAFFINQLIIIRKKIIENAKLTAEEEIRASLLKEEQAFVLRESTPVVLNDDNYFLTEDGRKVKYLDNPLPTPKKKRVDMRFNLDSIRDENKRFGIYNNERLRNSQSENMKLAGVGIENVVKLQPNYKDVVVLNPLDSNYDKLNKLGSMTKTNRIDDFDFWVDGDDFDY